MLSLSNCLLLALSSTFFRYYVLKKERDTFYRVIVYGQKRDTETLIWLAVEDTDSYLFDVQINRDKY